MITINETNFPDANFRNWLLAQDYGKDGVLTEEAIKGITEIDVSRQDISSLKGIEHFTALKKLDCSWNRLTSLNVSGCTALKELRCFLNKLTDLDLSGYTALKELHCFENNLTNLDVSGCAALKELCCNLNELTSLDLSECTALTILDCEKNKLTSLNVSGCTALKKLYCNLNKLTDLDLSECTALTAIDCSDNKNELTILELSKQLQTATAGNAESTLAAPFCLPEPPADENGDNGVDMTYLDPLFEDAARLIVMSQCGSTSLVQRKFSIGYNRGCRLMDQLEKAGVVGKFANSKPREVLIKDEASLTALLDNLKKSNN